MRIEERLISDWECNQVDNPKSYPSSGKKKRTLCEDYTHVFPLLNGQKAKLTIPEGYEYEMSIPRPIQPFKVLLFDYYALEGSVVAHDWIYRHKGEVTYQVKKPSVNPSIGLVETNSWKRIKGGRLTQKQADLVLVSDPKDSEYLRWVAYRLARVFGAVAWDDIIEEV
jgi:hypothetical protein